MELDGGSLGVSHPAEPFLGVGLFVDVVFSYFTPLPTPITNFPGYREKVEYFL